MTAPLVSDLIASADPLFDLPIRVETMIVSFCDLAKADEACVAVSVIAVPEAGI